LAVKIHDERTGKEFNIHDVVKLSIDKGDALFSGLTLTERQTIIAQQILKEITQRLKFLLNVGLEYLTLDRTARSLSGGEAQRIRLATQIGTQLVGVMYILDEPSIGLHQRDNIKLINSLRDLRDLGNTVIVVEHDREMIEAADFVVDLGPGAGEHGGHVVGWGEPRQLGKSPQRGSNGGSAQNGKTSLTGSIFGEVDQHTGIEEERSGNAIVIRGASGNNFKSVDLDPTKFVCITG
jgi:excinuclease ABC subunit A